MAFPAETLSVSVSASFGFLHLTAYIKHVREMLFVIDDPSSNAGLIFYKSFSIEECHEFECRIV